MPLTGYSYSIYAASVGVSVLRLDANVTRQFYLGDRTHYMRGQNDSCPGISIVLTETEDETGLDLLR